MSIKKQYPILRIFKQRVYFIQKVNYFAYPKTLYKLAAHPRYSITKKGNPAMFP